MPTRASTPAAVCSPAAQRATGSRWTFPANSPNRPKPLPSWPTRSDADLACVGRNQFDYLVQVANEATLRALNPNHLLLRQLPVRGVIVTAPAKSPEYDFVSRFFAPGSGIDEDPVTGSAHYRARSVLGSELGKTEMTGFQASARGGVVKVRLEGDRVILAGPGRHRHCAANPRMKFRLPAETYDSEPPPILGTWRKVYILVIGWLRRVIAFATCSRAIRVTLRFA